VTDYTAFPSATGPGSSATDSSVNLALEFDITSAAWLKGIRFWRADGAQDGAIQCRCWRVTTSSTGTAVSGSDGTYTLSGTGWQDFIYATPIALTIGQRYRAAVLFPSGYSATGGYFGVGGPGAGGITNGPLHVPDAAGGTGGFQGSFSYNAAFSYPDNGGNGNYWVTPIVTDVDPAGHPPGSGTASIALAASGSGLKVASGTGTATLALTASGGGSPVHVGAAAAQLGLAASGAGSHRGLGTRAAVLQLAAAGAGQHVGSGAGAAVLGLSAAAIPAGRDIEVVVGPLETRWAMGLEPRGWQMEEDG
jgi:hypothetical protein